MARNNSKRASERYDAFSRGNSARAARINTRARRTRSRGKKPVRARLHLATSLALARIHCSFFFSAFSTVRLYEYMYVSNNLALTGCVLLRTYVRMYISRGRAQKASPKTKEPARRAHSLFLLPHFASFFLPLRVMRKWSAALSGKKAVGTAKGAHFCRATVSKGLCKFDSDA